jgi:hypothetical protein
MLAGRAIMINWSNVAPEHRAAYYHWHGTEHMPGRLAIPGYRRGRRFIAVRATRDFLVLYEVDDIDVVVGENYLAKANNPSPLTRETSKHIKDSARALAQVKLSRGNGQGGYVLTLRFDVEPGEEQALERFVSAATDAASRMPGVVGAHFCIADMAASTLVPVERVGRPTTVPRWIMVLEGITLEAVEQAVDRHFDFTELSRHGAKAPIERDTYLNQICVAKLATA